MSSPADTQLEIETLSQRLSAGKLPVVEALRYAMLLAESLRKLHDAGQFHGALTPAHIVLTKAGLELIPAEEAPAPGPYTAPEVLQGSSPDQRSDIFALGTILFEMLTGRRAFETANAEAAVPASGSPTVDKLLRSCLAKDPSARYQRLQKLMMELKLLSVSVRRAESPSPTKAEATDAALRYEMAQMESRIAARLQAQEAGLSAIEHDAATALGGLGNQLSAIGVQLDGVQSRFAEDGSSLRAAVQQFEARLSALQQTVVADANVVAQTGIQQLESRIDARIQTFEQRLASLENATGAITGAQSQLSAAMAEAAAVSERAAARIEALAASLEEQAAKLEQQNSAAGERMLKLEAALDTFDREGALLRDSVTNDLLSFDRTIKAQAAAIDSARTAMGQTDDLVERVVEALESLQSIVLESADETK